MSQLIYIIINKNKISMKNIDVLIGKIIRRLRKSKKEQAEITAEKLNISVPYLRLLECGNTRLSIKRVDEFYVYFRFNPIKFAFLILLMYSDESILAYSNEVGMNDELIDKLKREEASDDLVDDIITWLYVPSNLSDKISTGLPIIQALELIGLIKNM